MGEVYPARDSKLDRDVAIKVLPEEFSNDEERLARFEREAKLLASLNHPHIASIHEFEESGGVHALVLELAKASRSRIESERVRYRSRNPSPSRSRSRMRSKQVTRAGVIHRHRHTGIKKGGLPQNW